jgi:hypothetical protein
MSKRRQNKAYKRKIYALCRKAAGGDSRAVAELALERDKDNRAVWAIKHWKKIQKNKTRRAINQKGRREHSSIYAAPRDSPRTEEEIEKQERINSRGYHEGATVGGSDVRRIDK